jgi:hypothetical protein
MAAPWNAWADVDLTDYEHVGWHCEHYDMTLLPDVAPASRIINAQCGCTMVPTYVKRAADAPSDEDRIRDAMAEAQDHPGHVITR